jgi:hypothetical protein
VPAACVRGRPESARCEAVTDEDEWHPMECGLCPETWWLPYGDSPYGTAVIDLAAAHWREHVRRGEDPRFEAIKAGRQVSGA